ncbi:MAG: alpha-galactosidase [Eubacteriales bacterium]|nr:alpha-galactosidase [Eubacteriales bacterium]
MAIQTIDGKVFGLHTKNTTYILSINEEGLVENLYWGKKITSIEDFAGVLGHNPTINVQGGQLYREECSSFGGMRFKETSLKVTFADGVRDFRYVVEKTDISGEHLEIVLTDIYYPFAIHLHYEVYEEEDIIRKWRVAENRGKEPILLERIYSAEYGLPGDGWKTVNYKGRWGAEFCAHSDTVQAGKQVYESLYGLTAHTVNPVFLIHKDASETRGDVYFGALEYSGNFKTVVEPVNTGYLNILMGISDTDFAWTLKGGESFETPAVCAGYSAEGFQTMTHILHSFCTRHIMPEELAGKPLPMLYNSWYSTTFDVRCEEQVELAKRAAKMGVELFVVDDGWFEGRVDDTAALGDWYVDKEKFPNGLQELIREVNNLGMKFGLWIEPEMTNKKSKLFMEHPDWIYQYDTREVLMGRNQYELDMSNPEVVDYLIEIFDNLLKENNIEYIKWDMNRYAAEMGSRNRNQSQWKELWYRNTQGVYRLIRELRARHPHVEFEACASGGGRVDYGAMRYFDEYWPSDNTDALDRLYMQQWYSYFYPIKYMRAWLTDDFGMDQRKIPLQFSMYCAMCGSLGIGTDLNKTSDEKLDELAGYIALYKEIREVIQLGKLYRLNSFTDGDIHAVQYVKDKKSVVFAFLDHERYGDSYFHIYLRGLKPDKKYRVKLKEQEEEKSGAFLMNMGIPVILKGDYDSVLIQLEED